MDVCFYKNGSGVIVNDYDLQYDVQAGTFTALYEGEEAFVITLTGVETAEINGIEFMYEMYEYEDGDVDYSFYSEESNIEFEASPWLESISKYSYFTYTMDDTTITIDGYGAEYSIDEDAGIMIFDGEEYEYIDMTRSSLSE